MINLLTDIPGRDEELFGALIEAYFMARRGKRSTADEYNFEAWDFLNIEQLASDINNRVYKPSRGKAFITHKPVVREIFAAPFRDRVVHHLLYALNANWWDRHFIYDSYSCREKKGTQFGVERAQTFMRRASLNGLQEAYVIKADISGYFMSLDRKMLYEEICWGLSRQFPDGGWLYDLCMYLWYETIFDDPTKGVTIAGDLSEWNELPLNKSLLYHEPNGKGIVIGNLTSQLLSNIFLNRFDWFMKRDLEYQYYGRYVDDFFVVVKADKLHEAVYEMETIVPTVLEEMGLKKHPKKVYCQEVHKGMPFLGRMIYLDKILPGKRVRRNFYQAAEEYMMGLRYDESMISYLGMGEHMSMKKLCAKVFDSVGWDFTYDAFPPKIPEKEATELGTAE